jgi:oligo-1,6-glucosidase
MTSIDPTFDWRKAVVYQIYPRSFCDSNGDGIGDLPGITSRLDYLQDLGVQVVWLSPIYASPNDDNGYDISDYRAIMPEFGSMSDFYAMLAGMHVRGIRLMMDLVVNHTSDEHPWFVQARSSRSNPYHGYYIWAEPLPDGSPPNNWEAAFQGSVWTWNEATGEYYLHMFSAKQPDLNWENPKVRQEVYDLMRYWLDNGVDGFRMDVINMISKPWDAQGRLPQAPVVREGFLQPSFEMTCNGPRLNEFLREMRQQVLDHYDTITVGEAPLATVQQGRDLTHPNTGALNMLFQFEHMDLDSVGGHVLGKWARKPLDWRDMKACMARWQVALQNSGWNSLYFCNHDQPRSVSRFGHSGEYREASAKALATWLHGMQGTPYIYQGEELGMTNVAFEQIEDYRDIETLNYYRVASERGQSHAEIMASVHAVGRDNARTPMPWHDGVHAGFTTGQPWIDLNPDYRQVNAAAAQADPESVFHHYRQLVALRKQWPVLRDGRFELLWAEDTQICGYARHLSEQVVLVVVNMGLQVVVAQWPENVAANRVTCLLSNMPQGHHRWGQPLQLQPYEALMLLCE